jgi:hypothetical protein
MPVVARAIEGCAFLAFSVPFLSGYAQDTPLPTPAQQAIHPTTFTTPMEIDYGKPYVNVMVNGHGPYRFMVDTGTGGEAIISIELADELKLPKVDKTRLSDPSKEGMHYTDVVMIDTLNIGGAEFNEVFAARHRTYGADIDCQGILGFPLFENYLLTLDYPNRRMVLSSGALVPDGESLVLPFRMPDGVPIAPLRIGDLRVEAQFDSGGTGLSLPQRLVPQLRFSADPIPFGLAESLSSRFEIKLAKLASDIRLGQFTFDKPFVEINSAFPLVNFGAYPMVNFSITFDQLNQLLRIDAGEKVLHLAPTPMLPRMLNAPAEKPADRALFPIG